MRTKHARQFSRREFLRGVTLAGTTGLLGLHAGSAAAAPPPETTRIKLQQVPAGICRVPEYMAEELLHGEGFTDVQYVKTTGGWAGKELAAGEIDITMNFVGPLIVRLDAGDPIILLAGGHIGCFELFGTDRVRAIRDLQGKPVAVRGMGYPDHVFIASMAAYVGLDPRKDIHWVLASAAESRQFLTEGKIDAFVAFPPQAQELRAQKIGHVVVNSTIDRPWSQYFCCLVTGNQEFVRKHPVATKRALRAILKGTDVCALDPDGAARRLVDRGFTQRYDYALQVLQEIPYGKWREYNPEDTVRFYALRLQEVGMIKSSPQKMIAQGTDWRFLTELKKELKE